ncbi:nitronate monooxygenase [Enterovibrio sp. ZSDZ35]|uniref:Propionate 3-nitronate monooxygenase n=1 Tax=Enterovibrio qingdaonensis TaxID=2899818 RepID=A0ABT5QPG5_9GAMM|nr:nitronate monooxygenase [Enterovibrio sp. ZSDZ35]MDD1782874.1 nitronate monooxygenase [Enterovibrio sp. ZSDZ35]
MTITEYLGIEFPIIQAPMAGVQDAELAIAVSEAGGLGSLPCAMLDAEAIANEVGRIKTATTKPYNLNFFCHKMLPFDEDKHRLWRKKLTGYFNTFGVDEKRLGNSASRLPFDHDIADVVEPFAPPVISFHFGLPEPQLLQRVKGWGAVVLSSATTLEEGLWLEANGCDVVIAQGIEAGGHRGMFLSNDLECQIGTTVLVDVLARHLSVPIVAAGGIASAQDVLDIMSQGADGVQIGSAFLLSDEAKTSRYHRQAIQSEAVERTAITNIFSGRPARGIVNKAMLELGNMNTSVPAFPYPSIEMTPLRAAAEAKGLEHFTPLWCGTNAKGIKSGSAKSIMDSLVKGISA